MTQTLQEKNKALVLEAFDTLFNKRDYAAAERYWSPALPGTHLGEFVERVVESQQVHAL